MSDLTKSLLGPQPPMQEGSSASSIFRPVCRRVAAFDSEKRERSVRHWIRIDKFGESQVLNVDKMTIMRRCHLPARDLRLLDPLFVYPSTILGREKAIVVNLERIRCVITADEVLLSNSLDSHVLQYVTELQRRLTTTLKSDNQGLRRKMSMRSNAVGLDLATDDVMSGLKRFRVLHQDELAFTDCLPFEFKALEVALEAACNFLDSQAIELEIEAYPVLDELTSKVNTINLERLRKLKSRLVTLTSRVQKMRDEVEQLMDDAGDMAEMYLTEKKERMEAPFHADNPAFLDGETASAPVSPVGSPPRQRTLEKTISNAFSYKSRHSSVHSSENASENIEQLEMLLEAYFVIIDSTLNKLTSLKQYVDDTEDFINIHLDNVRNQLIQFELLLTTATFVVAIYGVVAGVFGMNIEISIFDEPAAFKWVIIIAGLGGLVVFSCFLLFFRWKGLIPLP